MTAKNERMKQHALILSMLPDLVLAVCRSGEMTYVSPAAKWLLLHSPEEVTGANIFELVTPDCHALLRSMISDNLARPVVSRMLAGDEGAGRSSESGSSSGGDSRRPTMALPQGNHRDRLQQRYIKGQSPAVPEGSQGAGNGGGWPCSVSSHGGAKMLRLIRCDKTTVWCETRLSVRTAKDDPNRTPIEIILTLRTMSEGNRTTAGNGLPSAHRSAVKREGPTAAVTAAGAVRLEDAECDEDDDDDDNDDDDDGHVEDDDDGYRCEQEEDEGNNSGSGNDMGGVRPRDNPSADSVAKKQKLDLGGMSSSNKSEEVAPSPTGGDSTGVLEEGREERSLLRMKNMGMFDTTKAGEDGSKGGEAGEDSSTGGDTGGSTTQEGSASCSNEADSNGEGSNTGSKWGEACRSNDSGESGGSEDGSSDGSSAERELGDEVQNAVQSLILMGGSFGNDGEGGGGGGESETTQ